MISLLELLQPYVVSDRGERAYIGDTINFYIGGDNHYISDILNNKILLIRFNGPLLINVSALNKHFQIVKRANDIVT